MIFSPTDEEGEREKTEEKVWERIKASRIDIFVAEKNGNQERNQNKNLTGESLKNFFPRETDREKNEKIPFR